MLLTTRQVRCPRTLAYADAKDSEPTRGEPKVHTSWTLKPEAVRSYAAKVASAPPSEWPTTMTGNFWFFRM